MADRVVTVYIFGIRVNGKTPAKIADGGHPANK